MASAQNRASGKRKVGVWPTLVASALVIGLSSCGGDSTGPQDDSQDATTIFAGLTVSDVAGASTGDGALASATLGVTYVSACPGTFLDALSVTIRNLSNGATRAVNVVDGGFDPVTLQADAGDEIEILVRHIDGSTSRYLTRVPTRKRPRVVRTVPPKDATDVVLSVSAVVVFSEPVDASTVTAENIQLLLDDQLVEGGLGLSNDGLKAELTPAESLQPETTYSLVVRTGVLDMEGEAIEEEVRATFTTVEYEPPPEVYVPIDLGSLAGIGGGSRARDLSEPLAGRLIVVGGSEKTASGSDTVPVVWMITLNDGGRVTDIQTRELSLPSSHNTGFAHGTNDQGNIVVGRAGRDSDNALPIMWSGSSWTRTDLVPLGSFPDGVAADANDQGTTVGWSEQGAAGLKKATAWEAGNPTQPLALPDTFGILSKAFAINNQGYVAGYWWEQSGGTGNVWNAVLWRPPYTIENVCVLDRRPEGRSHAWNLTDVIDGTVLIAGYLQTFHEGEPYAEQEGVVWRVTVTDCSIDGPITMGISDATAFDVRGLGSYWEAVGRREPDWFDWRPTLFGFDGRVLISQLPVRAGTQGSANGINRAGQISGWTEDNGTRRAVLWIK